MLPFEFTVEGPPISLQTKNKARLKAWKTKVADAASNMIAAGNLAVNIDVTFQVTYYYDTQYPDVDNIIKPIQDALVGIVYVDDDQVVETASRRKNINGAYKIKGASPLIVQGFVNGVDFLHVRIEGYINNQELE